MTLVENLLAAETTERAIEVARQSDIQPRVLSEMLTEHADRVREDRPAAAVAAEFLARLVGDLEKVRPWSALDHLSDAQNDLLHRASLTSGMGAFRLLREESEHLSEEVMFSVLAWHADLAQKGVPAAANGAGLVAILGVILGGVSLAFAHMTWARYCETVSPARAERHLLRARKLMRSAGSDGGQEAAATALNSFYARFGGGGRPDAPGPVSRSRPALFEIPLNESRAADLREAGCYRESLAVLDISIPAALEAGIMPSAMRMLGFRGLVHDDLSEYAQSEEDFREAARLAGQLGDEGRRFEALNNSAASFLKRGEPQRALPAFRAILRNADAKDDEAKQVAARNNLATAYAFSGNHCQARDLYLEALRLMGDSPSNSRWIALVGLATAQDQLSDQEGLRDTAAQLWEWAEGGYEGALMAYLNSAACDLSRPDVAIIAEEVWRSHLECGHVLEAAGLSLQFARRHEETDPDRSLNYLDTLLNGFSSERSGIAVLIEAETEAAKLEAGALNRPEAAVSRLRAGVDRAERQLADLDSSSDADWLLDLTRPLYVGLLHLLLEDGDPDSLPEAIWLHEACRAATLTSSHSAEPATRATGLRGRVADLNTVEQVLATQPGQRLAVLSYYETETEVGAFVLQPGSPVQRVGLDVTPTELDEAAKQLSVAFNGDSDAFPPRRPPAARDVETVDLALAERVLSELGEAAARLEGPGVLCVVPSPRMAGLPLHAVQLPSGRRLIQEFGVVQQPSLSSFVTTARLATSQTPPRTIFVAGVAAAEDQHPEFFEADHAAFARRPGVLSLTGEDVTPAAVIDGLRSAEVAHVSSHGFVDVRDPLGSGLLLSDGKRRPSRRTQSVPIFERAAFELTVRQLMEQRMETQLLTLRACSTARRSSVAGKNEMSTLTRVLHAAGCRTVISTLWNVDQRSSLQLFARFYSMYLDAEMSPCDAMAQAQRELLNSGPPHSHLYHWAPFVLSGDWRPP